MDTTILKEFVSLFETCSFQETAEHLHLSQSALTKHIHKLEEELGVSLFDRSTRSVSLNDFSRTFYPFAREIVSLDEKGRHAIEELHCKNKDILRIAFTPSTSHYGLIDFLSYFSKKHTEITLEINESFKVVETLEKNECEFAFATDNDMIESTFNKVIYQKDYLVIIVPENHHLAEKSSVTLNDIRNERFILHQNSRGGLHLESRQIMELFEKHGIYPEIASKVSFTSSVIKFVEHGDCIAALPYNRIPPDGYGIKILDFVPHIESFVYMLYPSHKRLIGASAVFLQFILDNLDEE